MNTGKESRSATKWSTREAFDFLREICTYSGGELAQEALAFVEEEHRRLWEENNAAWATVAETQRRLLIVSNAVRGFERFLQNRKSFGRSINKT